MNRFTSQGPFIGDIFSQFSTWINSLNCKLQLT